MAEDHLCRCTYCYPPLDERLEPAVNHFGIWFPDQARLIRVYRVKATVEIRQLGHTESMNVPSDGEDISTSCWQVIVGEAGKAWRYSEPKHRCYFCGHGVCSYIELGHFMVTGATAAPDWWAKLK